MVSKKIVFVLSALLGLACVFAVRNLAAQDRALEKTQGTFKNRANTAIAIPSNHINAVPNEITSRFSADIVEKLPPAVWKGVVDQKIDLGDLDLVMDPGETPEVVQCPPLEFAVEFTQAECNVHRADACGTLESDCDSGFSDGQPVVTGGSFGMVWKVRNGVMVADNCHAYSEIVSPNGLGEFNAGGVHWNWDGPYPGSPAPSGYTALNEPTTEDAFAFVPESLIGISDAWAGGTSYIAPRKGGRFNCKAFALGKCWQFKEVPYSYSCTNNGVGASPR